MPSREKLDKYTRNILTTITCVVLICFLIDIVVLRSRQETIVEDKTPTFSYTNLEEIEDIKPTPDPEYIVIYDEAEVEALAKMVYGETHGALSKTEMSACVWVVCNRADNWNMSILEVLNQSGQFTGYKYGNPVTEDIRTLVMDVLARWQIEKQGASAYEVCRTIPQDFMWWNGNGSHNIFRNAYTGNYTVWDWSLPNPYGE